MKYVSLLCCFLVLHCASAEKVADYKLSQSNNQELEEINYVGEDFFTEASLVQLTTHGKQYTGVVAPVFLPLKKMARHHFALKGSGKSVHPIHARFEKSRFVEVEDPDGGTKKALLAATILLLVVVVVAIAMEGKSVKFKPAISGLPTVKVKFPKLPRVRIRPLPMRTGSWNGSSSVNFRMHFHANSITKHSSRGGSDQCFDLGDLDNDTGEVETREPTGYAFLVFENFHGDCPTLVHDRGTQLSIHN